MAHKCILFAVLFVIIQVSLVKSQQAFECNGHQINVSQEKVDAIKKCGEAVGAKSMEEITPDKIPCLAKCIMESGGLVDDQGKPHKENIMRSIDAAVTDAGVKDIYKKEMEKCLDEHGQKLVPGDKTCASYAPLAMCVTKAFMSICKS